MHLEASVRETSHHLTQVGDFLDVKNTRIPRIVHEMEQTDGTYDFDRGPDLFSTRPPLYNHLLSSRIFSRSILDRNDLSNAIPAVPLSREYFYQFR